MVVTTDRPRLLPYHGFNHDGASYLYNVEQMRARQVDDAWLDSLHDQTSHADRGLEPDTLRQLKELGLVANGDGAACATPAAADHAGVVNTLSLLVAQSCNLGCVYCYAGSGEYGHKSMMNDTVAKKAIDWLIQQSAYVKSFNLVFFGGEPLINFKLIERTVAYCEKRGAETGKVFNFGIITNGTLLDDRIIAFLKEKKVSVVVSFDGPPEVQDLHRPFRGKVASTHAHLMPRIRKLLEALPNTSARATLYGDVDPVKVVTAIKEAGFPTYYLVEAARSAYDRPEQAGDFAASARRMSEFAVWEAKEILGAIKARNADRVRENKSSVFGFTTILLTNNKRCHSCGIGKAYVVVSTRGEIYPCHGFVDMPKYQIGHVDSKLLQRNQYLKSPTTDPTSVCSRCWAKNLCGGGCKVDHFGATGSMFEPNQVTCDLIRSRAEVAIDLRHKLDDSDVTWLQEQGIVPKTRIPLDFLKA